MGCLFCGSNELEMVWENQYYIPLEDGIEVFKVSNSICKQCGIVFQNPQLTDEEMEKLYRNQYRLSVNQATALKSRVNQYEFCISNVNKEEGTILDIGCGEGYFLSFFKNWRKYGVEPSLTAVERARENYSDEKIVCDFYENVKYDENKFDCISIRHVLEHVKNPIEVLKKIKKELKEDGVLYIEVPNVYDCVNLGDITDFFGYQHLYHFSTTTISNFLRLVGFDIKKIDIADEYPGIRVSAVKSGVLNDYTNDYNHFVSKFKNSLINKQKRRDYIKNMLNDKNVEWEKSKKNIYIYGAGMHTEELMKLINLKNYNIIGLIDKSKDKQKKRIFGYKVYSENVVKDLKNSVIIISSYAFQDEIYEELKLYMDDRYELIKLYNEMNMLPYLS